MTVNSVWHSAQCSEGSVPDEKIQTADRRYFCWFLLSESHFPLARLIVFHPQAARFNVKAPFLF